MAYGLFATGSAAILPGRFVRFSEPNRIVTASTGTIIVGVSDLQQTQSGNAGDANGLVPIQQPKDGSVTVIAGGTISAGALVRSNASGAAVAVTPVYEVTSGDNKAYVFGQAMTDGAAGSFISVAPAGGWVDYA